MPGATIGEPPYGWLGAAWGAGTVGRMLFMVIEQFVPGRQDELYRRIREEGRGLPEGLRYLGSWIDASFTRCWQLMEADDAADLLAWVADLQDDVAFEIVPVVESSRVQQLMAQRAGARPA